MKGRAPTINIEAYYAFLYTWIILTFLMLLARLYLRIYVRYSLSFSFFFSWMGLKAILSDLLVIIAWCSFTTFVILARKMDFKDGRFFGNFDSITIKSGERMTDEEFQYMIGINFFNTFAYYVCLYTVKLAIIMLYGEIIPNFFVKIWWSLKISAAIIVGLLITFIAKNFFACIPVSKNWIPDANGKTCTSIATGIKFFYVFYISHIATDIVCVVVPLYLIYVMWERLPKVQRWGAAIMLSLGIISLTCSLTVITLWAKRWTFTKEGAGDTSSRRRGDLDSARNISMGVELATAVAVSSFPAFKAVIVKGFKVLKRQEINVLEEGYHAKFHDNSDEEDMKSGDRDVPMNDVRGGTSQR